MKKKIGLLTVAVLLLSWLVACAKATPTPTAAPTPEPTQASTTTEETPTAEPTSAPTEEKVLLRFWMHQEAPFEASYQQLVDAYQAEHPNVEITIETFDYDTYIQTLQTAMPAGEEADILEMFGTWVCGYADRLAPMPEEVMTVDQAHELYYNAPIGGYTCNDTLYGLPLEFNIEYGGVLVNKQMYEEAGLTYPPAWETWDDVINDAKALTKFDGDTMTVAGFDFSSSDPIAFFFLAGILQNGGDFWKPDHSGFTFNTPEAKASLEFMESLVKEHKVVDPVLFNDDVNWVGDAFFSNQASIAYIGPWAVAMGLNDFPDFGEFGYYVLPPIAGNEHKFVADSGWGLTVSPNSAHQDVAWDFVKFVAANKENAIQWNMGTMTIPAIKENAESDQMAEAMPWIEQELQLLPHGEYLGAMPDRDLVMYEVIYPHVLNVLQGLESVDDALQAIDAEANATFE